MGTEQVFHMNGGVGDTSYANNSSHQRNGVLKGKHILEEIIRKVYYTINPKCLKVADLGCASGPNALMMVNDIINIIESTSFNFNRKPPSFQFYMNDLPSNDFNTIFKSLAQFYETLEEKKGPRFGPCFINATPGTFYKRLFPDNSIHFFHSTYSVHWLSEVKSTPNPYYCMNVYNPTAEEAKAVIEEEGSFTIQRLESMMLGWDANINEDELDENSRCEFIAKTFRAITETLLKARFGEDIMDELYLRLKNKLIQMLMKGEKLESPNLVISLVKKSYKDANGNGATQVL